MPYIHKPVSFAAAAAASMILAGCGSSSSSSDVLTSIAVDGYIVGAQVLCDDVSNGGTAAGGVLSCPSDTSVSRARGGSDVGFDATVDTGGIPFVGELAAPADLGYLTPLSTLALILSSTEEGYDAALWDESVSTLATGLGQSDLDLSLDAAAVMQLVRLNAQINQVLSSFSLTEDDYVIVAEVFAGMIRDSSDAGLSYSLDSGVEQALTELNDRLAIEEPRLHKSEVELSQVVDNVLAVNTGIQLSESPEPVATLVSSSRLGAALTLNREDALVSFHTRFGQEVEAYSIEQFEDSAQRGNQYATTVNADGFDLITINNDAFNFNSDLEYQRVSMAVSITSTDAGDSRSLTMLSNDVFLTADENDNLGTILDLPADGLLHLSSTSKSGVATEATVSLQDSASYEATDGFISVSVTGARHELSQQGIADIFSESGNFEVTVIIAGLRVNETDGATVNSARQFQLDSGDQTLSGSGFRGYVTYFPY